MKKIWGILLTFMFILSGCVRLSPEGPEMISIEDKTYKTGFYGTLFPNTFEFDSKTLKSGNIILNKIKHEEFELYQTDIGTYSDGTIYCAESDYDDAVAYYNDPQNYSYYCIIGVDSDTTSAETVDISQVDPDKFEALLIFADKSSYDPFDEKHNAEVNKVDLPMPDDTKDNRLIFYKESIDSLFISNQGPEYYIIDNSLYLVYQYDFGHGEYEKLIAVKAPDDIGAYFIELMSPYI